MPSAGTLRADRELLTLNPYLERHEPEPNRVDRLLLAAASHLPQLGVLVRARLRLRARAVLALAPEMRALSDADLLATAQRLRQGLARAGLASTLVVRSFALVREATRRHLELEHYPVQLMGGFAMLDGRLAEMQTGEGKTITALLPAVTAALAGRPVHVVTVNDYLAQRDAEELRPVYEALGLSVGLVRSGQTPDMRRAAYRADIAYCTNKDLVFDYLRDRAQLGPRRGRAQALLDEALPRDGGGGQLLLRGLHFAIVDEADSVLIDEARTPLILSTPAAPAKHPEQFAVALDLARILEIRRDYTIDLRRQRIEFTEPGRDRLRRAVAEQSGLWHVEQAREGLIVQALSALHFYQLDKQYIVADEKIQIVDESTGRVMPDRSWEHGLHQMIEAKEGVPITGERRTLAQITYQRFFRRYRHLTGMSGTLREASAELRAVFGLRVVRIPPNRRSRRRNRGVRMYLHSERRWRAVALRTVEMSHDHHRPVLVGTRSVAASEEISRLLAMAAIPHTVLNARQDADEAEIIARAGAAGAVTIATNMAGRGTDIRLAPGVAEAGGLHMILTEFHESKRVDRQLFGRCARQGDLGSHEAIIALDDELFRRFTTRLAQWSAKLRWPGSQTIPKLLARQLRNLSQNASELRHAKARKATVEADRKREKALAFAGPLE